MLGCKKGADMKPRSSPRLSIERDENFSEAYSKRLTWVLKDRGHLLPVAVRKDTSPEAREIERLPEKQIPEHVGQLILERGDPTAAKAMTSWLVRQYAQGALRLEDLGTAHETLEMFHRYKPKLSVKRRDLGQYACLADIWKEVYPLAKAEQSTLSGKTKNILDKGKAYAESYILRQDSDGFTIAVPLTEFAAKWWGRGTRWCTAAKRNNAFWSYHEKAPLLVIVVPELRERGKFQLWVTEDNIQFMDASDSPISSDLIAEYWARFGAVISFAVNQNSRSLGHVPQRFRTEEMYKIAIRQDVRALRYLPVIDASGSLISSDLITGYWLRFGPVISFAVNQNGLALEYVPHELRTEELCRIAVAQDGWALKYVPQKLRTDEMCRIAVKQDGRPLQYVPEPLRTEEMYRLAVAQNGQALDYVPGAMRTKELYRLAITQDGSLLKCVPEDLRSEELCRIAVAQDGRALEYVPLKLRTEAICKIAVAQAGLALVAVPDVLLTGRRIWRLCGMRQTLRAQRKHAEEICRIAVMQNGAALDAVPDVLRTEELCRMAVEQNGQALRYVPEEFRTEYICKIAIAQAGGAFFYVPRTLRNEEMRKNAAAHNKVTSGEPPEALPVQFRDLNQPPIRAWDLSLLEDLNAILNAKAS